MRAFDNFGRDVTHAARSLRRSPGLVLTSVLSLALGIGVNTTLFSAITAVFLSQPTASEPERLVWVEPGNNNQFSYLNYRDLRDRMIFSEVFGYRLARLSLRSDSGPQSVNGMAVTGNFFQGLGVSAQLGRTFTGQEAEAAPHMAVISYRFWTRQFAGDPTVVGREITVNGQPFVLLGVLSDTYRPLILLIDPDMYVPVSELVLPNLSSRENGNALNVLGRLQPNSSREQAQAAVTTLGRDLERSYPEQNEGMSRPAKVEAVGRMSLTGAPLAAKIFPHSLRALRARPC